MLLNFVAQFWHKDGTFFGYYGVSMVVGKINKTLCC